MTPLSLWTQHPMSKGGKMAGMWSWGNTSPLSNEFCMFECSFANHCYAKRYCMIRPNMNAAYTRNGEILSKPMKDNLLSWAPLGSHRIQAFGELLNMQHWRNCKRLAELNPASKFTIWTKRIDLIESDGLNWPTNLQVIASGKYLSNDRIRGYPTFNVSKTPPDNEIWKCQKQCIHCQYCYGWSRNAGLNIDVQIWEKPR